jgi:hypothetical protein
MADVQSHHFQHRLQFFDCFRGKLLLGDVDRDGPAIDQRWLWPQAASDFLEERCFLDGAGHREITVLGKPTRGLHQILAHVAACFPCIFAGDAHHFGIRVVWHDLGFECFGLLPGPAPFLTRRSGA